MNRILGQARAVDILQTALRTGRLHHAYIFHGPAGVGKFTAARAFAATLLCHQPDTDPSGLRSPCGRCDSCKLLGHMSSTETADNQPNAVAHPDFHVVTKELARFSNDSSIRARKLTSIPVQVLRSALIEPVYRAPQMGRAKVFIVDEAHLLNATGQNLLLKTLEEPPLQTYIILVTDSEDRLLTTIRSRCQRIAFVPLPDALVAQWLNGQADQLESDHRDWLITFSLGCPGRARLAINYDLFAWAQAVLPALEQMTQRAFPAQLGQGIAQFIDDFAKRWVKDHDGSSKEAANRLAAALMAGVIAAHARTRIAQLASQCDRTNPDGAQALLDPWLGAVDALDAAERELATNVNLSIVADHLVSMLYRSLSGFQSAGVGV